MGIFCLQISLYSTWIFIKRFCSTHNIIGFIRNSTIMHVKYNLLDLFNLSLFYIYLFFFFAFKNIRTNKKRTFSKQKRTSCMCMYIAETCKSKGNCNMLVNSQKSTIYKLFSWRHRKNSCLTVNEKTILINMLRMLLLTEHIFCSISV